MQKKVPLRLASSVESHTASVTSSTGPPWATPAQFTRTSRPSIFRAAWETMADQLPPADGVSASEVTEALQQLVAAAAG